MDPGDTVLSFLMTLLCRQSWKPPFLAHTPFVISYLCPWYPEASLILSKSDRWNFSCWFDPRWGSPPSALFIHGPFIVSFSDLLVISLAKARTATIIALVLWVRKETVIVIDHFSISVFGDTAFSFQTSICPVSVIIPHHPKQKLVSTVGCEVLKMW